MVGKKVFINYRRDDAAPYALNIAQYFEREFGSQNVFIDVDRLRPGEKFPEVLAEHLRQCQVMVTVIGPRWLDLRNENGMCRINDINDWVRLEIEEALRRNLMLVPIIVGGAELPKRVALPESIASLADHQAISLTTTNFRQEMASLVRHIEAKHNKKAIPAKSIFAIGAFIIAFALVAFYIQRPLGGPRDVTGSDVTVPMQVQSSAPEASTEKALMTASPGVANLEKKIVWTTAGPVIDASGDWGLTLNASYISEFNPPSNDDWWLGVVLETKDPVIVGLAPRPVAYGGLASEREAANVRFPKALNGRIVTGSAVWVAPDDPENPSGYWSFRAFPTKKIKQ